MMNASKKGLQSSPLRARIVGKDRERVEGKKLSLQAMKSQNPGQVC